MDLLLMFELQVRTDMGRIARFPISGPEILFCAVLVTVGLLFAARLRKPLLQAVRALETQTQQRRSRGGRFLDRAALRGRDLRNANLANASLRFADLSDTDLRGANLEGADLEGAHLIGATYDGSTRWPEGIDPRKRGARRADPPAPSGDR
jgi:hypothetical protein